MKKGGPAGFPPRQTKTELITLSTTTTQAKNLMAAKSGFVELPATVMLQELKRNNIDLVLPASICRYYGITAAEFVKAEIYLAEQGVYVKFKLRSADYQ